MSKSLSITTGDLSVTKRRYDTVTGKDKLLQDLRCLLIERPGTDPLTPDFGSRLDSDTFIGNIYSDILAQETIAEITDVLQGYQASQLEKIKQETILYGGLNTLDKDEVIDSVDSVSSSFSGTTLFIQVTLTTLAGSSVRVVIPVDTLNYG